MNICLYAGQPGLKGETWTNLMQRWVVWECIEGSIWILCCHRDKWLPIHIHTLYHWKVKWLGFSFIVQYYTQTHKHTHCEYELMTYFCRLRLRLPLQLLILFWASRWFIPSVAMPSMDRTMSPTAIPPLAAFPPSVSYRNQKQHRLNYLFNHYSITVIKLGRSRWCGKYTLILY